MKRQQLSLNNDNQFTINELTPLSTSTAVVATATPSPSPPATSQQSQKRKHQKVQNETTNITTTTPTVTVTTTQNSSNSNDTHDTIAPITATTTEATTTSIQSLSGVTTVDVYFSLFVGDEIIGYFGVKVKVKLDGTIIIDDFKEAVLTKLTSTLKERDAASLYVYSNNCKGRDAPLGGFDIWNADAHGGGDTEHPLIVKVQPITKQNEAPLDNGDIWNATSYGGNDASNPLVDEVEEIEALRIQDEEETTSTNKQEENDDYEVDDTELIRLWKNDKKIMIAKQKERAIAHWKEAVKANKLTKRMNASVMKLLNKGLVPPAFHAFSANETYHLFPVGTRVSIDDITSDEIKLSRPTR